MAKTLRQLLDTHRAYLLDGSFKTYLAPDIPARKARAAIASYAYRIREQDILLLLDETVFGSADNGLVLTEDSIYLKPPFGSPASHALAGMASVSASGTVILVNGHPIIDLAMTQKKTVARLCDVLNQHLAAQEQAAPPQVKPVLVPEPQSLHSAAAITRPDPVRPPAPTSTAIPFPRNRIENSYFYRYRHRFVAYLRENVDNLEYRLYLALYDSFMSLATQNPAGRDADAALTWLVSDDETLFHSYILTSYCTGAHLAQHLPDREVQVILKPLLQVLFDLAMEELNHQPMSLGTAIDPAHALINTPRFKAFEQTYANYDRTPDHGDLLSRCFQGRCDETLSRKHGEGYRQALHLTEQQGLSFPVCLQQFARITQQNVERILIDFFSAIWR